MSKIAKRNYVKKHMDKFHKPKTQKSGKLYNRKKDRRIKDEMVSIREQQATRES